MLMQRLSRDGFEKMILENDLDAVVTIGSSASVVLTIGVHPGMMKMVLECCFRGFMGRNMRLSSYSEMDLNESFATLFPDSNQLVWDFHSNDNDCVIVQDLIGNEAGNKKRRQESTANAKKRRRLSTGVGRKDEKHTNLVVHEDSAVSSVSYSYSPLSGSSMAGEEDYAAPSCYSANVPMNYSSCGDEWKFFFSQKVDKECDQSYAESCGSNSPEQEDRHYRDHIAAPSCWSSNVPVNDSSCGDEEVTSRLVVVLDESDTESSPEKEGRRELWFEFVDRMVDDDRWDQWLSPDIDSLLEEDTNDTEN